ncbi:MAG: hypothetical protein HY828_19720 [Actinobacteria bacterium]|nr:hypothetical protein [Actinomycetota bacterium]
MSSRSSSGSSRPSPYGSAKDLPSYVELSQQIQGGKLLTRFVARGQRQKLIEIEEQMKRLTRVVDDFYDRLGERNWIFHDMLSVDKIEQLLAETADPKSAETRLVELYRDTEATKWWITRLRGQDGLRQRLHQVERARAHYDAGEFDSCTLQLIAVMDGFVNDFEPGERRGLHSRDPADMVAWDSVVGHHLGLTHAMATFTKTIKRRVDDEVFDVYRHGIMHGSVVNFDNPIVATKAWNMLFAVADWATATRRAAKSNDPPPTWSDTWATLKRHGAYKKYERDFVSSTIKASDAGFKTNEIVRLATEFFDAWQHGRWAIVAKFTPSALIGSKTGGEVARFARDVFEQHDLQQWEIESVTYDQASTAAIQARATVAGGEFPMRFRMVFWTVDGNVGIPGEDDGSWTLAVWAPHTYFQDPT